MPVYMSIVPVYIFPMSYTVGMGNTGHWKRHADQLTSHQRPLDSQKSSESESVVQTTSDVTDVIPSSSGQQSLVTPDIS